MKYLLLIVLVSLGCLQATPVTSEDFAFGISVEGSDKSSELSFELPNHFYQSVKSADLNDCRLYNKKGQQLPFSIVQDEQYIHTKETSRKALALFPVVNRGIVTRHTMSKVSSSYVNGASITISERRDLRHGDTPAFYILENRNVQKNGPSLQQLQFSWKQYGQTLIVPMRIEASDDLEQWRTLSSRETISRLMFQGEKIERPTVTIPATKARYLRISPDQREGYLTITAVNGIYSNVSVSQIEQEWQSLETPAVDTVPGSFIYKNVGLQLINKISFKAPASGYLYRGTIYGRNSQKESWRRVSQFTQYDILSGGDTLKSEPVSLRSQRSNQIKVVFTAPVDMDSTMLPGLSVGTINEDVHFLARGEAPYTFAYGNDTLGTRAESYKAMRTPVGVTVSSHFPLGGGVVVRSEPEREIPTKNIILWAILIVGVILVSGMAITLTRELKHSKGKNNE